jgi:hypothetical protein
VTPQALVAPVPPLAVAVKVFAVVLTDATIKLPLEVAPVIAKPTAGALPATKVPLKDGVLPVNVTVTVVALKAEVT